MRSQVINETVMNSLVVEAILTKCESRGLDVDLIESAYHFAEEVIGNRLRESDGTSFIGHFIRVAAILALELDVNDSEIIAAGFLHALISYSNVTHQELEGKFGKRISNLIKLWTLSSEEDQKHKELIRSLEIARDKLAPLVKLSDRLDNFRRLRIADRPGKSDKYIKQTVSLYFPFAKNTSEYIYRSFERTMEKLKIHKYG